MDNKLTVKVAKGLSGRRFATVVRDLKSVFRMQYDPATKTWTMREPDGFVAGKLRSYAANDMLVIVEVPIEMVVTHERVRTAELVGDLARQGYRPSFGRGATEIADDDFGDQGQVL